MDIVAIIKAVAPYAGAIIGQIGHMVKKKGELNKEAEPGNEMEIVKNLIVKKPFNTFAAIATAMVGVIQLVSPETSALTQFCQAFAIAWAADSAVNRPGQ